MINKANTRSIMHAKDDRERKTTADFWEIGISEEQIARQGLF